MIGGEKFKETSIFEANGHGIVGNQDREKKKNISINIGQEEMKGCSIKKKVLLKVLMSRARNTIGNGHNDDLHILKM